MAKFARVYFSLTERFKYFAIRQNAFLRIGDRCGPKWRMLPYTLFAAPDIYAAPIRINCATRHRKYRLKDIGARYYDANERFRPLESAWNSLSRFTTSGEVSR